MTLRIGYNIDIFGVVNQNDPLVKAEKSRPDSLPTPIWFPTEYIESRFDSARMAR